MNQLRVRKQALLVESELNRQTLLLEWQGLKASVSWVRTGMGWLRILGPMGIWLAPVAGLFVARQWPSREGWWHKALLAWRLWKRVAVVLGFLQSASPAKPEA